MLFGRVRHEGRARWVVEREGELLLLHDEPYGKAASPAARLNPGEVEWLPAVAPSKIIAVGRNYALHAKEHGAVVPEEPLLFLKAPSALLRSGDDVILPPESRQVEFEGELAVVVARRLRRWTGTDASEVLLGYTTADDVTARDLQRADGQWARAKSFDTFCPVAQWISPKPPAEGAILETLVNGEPRQRAPLADMIFSVAAILAHASAAMTLEPGDLVLTGTPAGVGPLAPGDRVSVSVTGVPELAHGARSPAAP